MVSLLDRLKQIQATRGLDDTQMAGLLGISHPLWSKTKNEYSRTTINWAVACGIARALPELHDELLLFMAQNGSVLPKSDTANGHGEMVGANRG